jgi:hypothetical protein
VKEMPVITLPHVNKDPKRIALLPHSVNIIKIGEKTTWKTYV